MEDIYQAENHLKRLRYWGKRKMETLHLNSLSIWEREVF